MKHLSAKSLSPKIQKVTQSTITCTPTIRKETQYFFSRLDDKWWQPFHPKTTETKEKNCLIWKKWLKMLLRNYNIIVCHTLSFQTFHKLNKKNEFPFSQRFIVRNFFIFFLPSSFFKWIIFLFFSVLLSFFLLLSKCWTITHFS